MSLTVSPKFNYTPGQFKAQQKTEPAFGMNLRFTEEAKKIAKEYMQTRAQYGLDAKNGITALENLFSQATSHIEGVAVLIKSINEKLILKATEGDNVLEVEREINPFEVVKGTKPDITGLLLGLNKAKAKEIYKEIPDGELPPDNWKGGYHPERNPFVVALKNIGYKGDFI